MFYQKKCTIILFLIILISAVSHAGLPYTEITITGNGTRGPYLLGQRNIIDNSLTVYRNNLRLDPEDFDIGYIEGVIWFAEVIPVAETLSVRFQYLPVTLQKQYYLHEIKLVTDVEYKDAVRKSGQVSPAESDISITGSKGFSIQSGEGADRLSQSLNLNIKGDLIPGLRTSAHISDKSSNNTEVTRRLNELDKIYVEAESEYFKGTFGDFDFVEDSGGLMNFRRKLTGLNLDYEKDNQNLRGAAGFFPGEYRRIDLLGVDGRLGPYYLTDVNGRQGVQILPGSDRVYIDGELLTRGSEKDYTIDYEAGTIQFAPSIIIRSESRLAIEYEIARDEYSRSFYATAGDVDALQGLTIFSKLIQEGDNGNSPKGFELTPENRDIIENAGSDPLMASKSGVTFQGAGQGDYNISVDSLGNQYFEYAGPDLGEYDVTFSFIGPGEGSYNPLGNGIYQYTGSGSGDYEPVILFPLPSLRRYGTAGANWKSDNGAANFYGELSGSIFDRNTLSQIDGLQKGTSGAAKFEYQNHLLNSEAFAGVGIEARKIGNGMVFPGRVDAVERYRNYDLDPASSLDGESFGEISLKGGLTADRNISLLYGDLRRPGGLKRKRSLATADWRLTGPLKGSGSFERTSGDRTWLKRNGEVSADFDRIKPSLGIDYENRDGEGGFKFYEYTGNFPVTYSSNVNSTTELDYRDEKTLVTAWRDKFRSGYIRQNIEFILGKTGMSGELNGSYYRKDYLDFSGPDAEQKSGWTRFIFNDPRERFEIKINERLGSSSERIQSRNFIFVGEGDGDYILEDGEYIKDSNGDYILVLQELGEGEKTTEINTEFYGSVHPFLFAASPGNSEISLGKFIIETDLAYNQKRPGGALTLEDFVPWKKDNLSELVFRSGRLDSRIYYYPPDTRQRIKYNLIRSYQDGQQYANEISSDNLSSDELSWDFPLGKKLDFELTGLISTNDRRINQIVLNLRRHKETASANYRFREAWSFKLGGAYEYNKQKESGIVSQIPSARSVLTRELGQRGRISADFIYYRVLVNPKGSYIPYQVAGGKHEGDNFEGNLRIRVEPVKNGKLDLSYRFENFAARPNRQNLRLEFTLLFL